jgi:hypothetical protein
MFLAFSPHGLAPGRARIPARHVVACGEGMLRCAIFRRSGMTALPLCATIITGPSGLPIIPRNKLRLIRHKDRRDPLQ